MGSYMCIIISNAPSTLLHNPDASFCRLEYDFEGVKIQYMLLRNLIFFERSKSLYQQDAIGLLRSDLVFNYRNTRDVCTLHICIL